jgi:hypothetical protein
VSKSEVAARVTGGGPRGVNSDMWRGGVTIVWGGKLASAVAATPPQSS